MRCFKIPLRIRFDASVPHYLSALRAKAALLSNRPARPLRVRPVRGRRTLCLPARKRAKIQIVIRNS